MPAYYNENDPYAAQWLRNLVDAGLIAAGDVDDRSIAEIHPADLIGYEQCHFFAGLGGWSRALRLAGWPDDVPVWTGSCPCQPFSAAGKRKGFADERHLWPEWFHLIRQCRPAIVFGEQVASASEWFGLVRGDLEEVEYAVGAMPIEAASVGANHKRDRLWFVAYPFGGQLWQQSGRGGGARGADTAQPGEHGAERDVADPNVLPRHEGGPGNAPQESGGRDAYRSGLGAEYVADSDLKQKEWVAESWRQRDWWRTEPDVGRVAHGVSARVAKLRALGNAIVPQVAAQFILAARP